MRPTLKVSESTSLAINSVVASWLFSASRQVLAETWSRALPIVPPATVVSEASNWGAVPLGSIGQEPKIAMVEPKAIMDRSQRNPLQPFADTISVNSLPRGENGDFSSTVVEELAYHRAELLLLQRSALKQLGTDQGWPTDLGALYANPYSVGSRLEEVSLENDRPSSPTKTDVLGRTNVPQKGRTAGVDDTLMRAALEDRTIFYRIYEVGFVRGFARLPWLTI